MLRGPRHRTGSKKLCMSLSPFPAAVPAVSPVVSMLRAATAAAHAAIEELVGLGHDFDIAHYRRVLRGFDAFLHAWEPLVARSLPPPLAQWFEPRRRSGAVRRDLLALGIAVPPPARLQLVLPGTAAALGSLYVLEGSALGAQVIAPRLQRLLGLDARNGAAYFAGWGAATGARWREFRERLEATVGPDDRDRAQAAGGAIATFDALSMVLRDELEPVAAR
jgi:heme oxygenase (biliverdin-IX-beta and delta-forming)